MSSPLYISPLPHLGIRIMWHALFILFISSLIAMPDNVIGGCVEAIVGLTMAGIMLLRLIAVTPIFQAIVALVAIFACLAFWGYSFHLSMKRQGKISSTVQQQFIERGRGNNNKHEKN
jgi:uncharacterized protein YacL